jgi:hypothetical protein
MTEDSDIAARLDKIIAILQLAHGDEIEKARAAIRADKVNAAILDATKKMTPSAKVMAAVKKKTRQSPATIARRISGLIEQGALEKQGGGNLTHYQATGLV